MHVTVTGKQVDVGDALRRHVENCLDSLLGKYFRTAIEAHAVFTREAHLISTDLSLHVGRGMVVNSSAAAMDHYLAFDAAAERLAKQLRRYKRRLRDYHGGKTRPPAERQETAQAFILAPMAEDEDDETAPPNGNAPVVIAEMSTDVPQLTVGEAVMRMDLGDTPVLLFRNRSHGELNVVYRREDGNIGWIDPAAPGRKGAGRA